ncbi:trypsin-like peptidase domain-containing protein [Limnofasciculus baicalensis]|uniref:Trypsin-like peptidase domain-containing protein n=1 Tax=Limnofasciculus baicalensis BBK-W-15 TaxID=2699891 RepID=A0AAE3GYK5_9CYAN|nr:trypsin-like peptidase domain-containing protein [Limnofasciculus baicalensis]MCP2732447.1 trypsin-like peptidase domain-containing protein [Limnofasciculus baicalensis BBK-W-15]
MSTKPLRTAKSAAIVAAVTLGATILNAIANVDFLNFSLAPNIASAQDIDEQINIRVYQRASPAVVSVQTNDSTGSGSIISSDGLVLTNAHVVAGSSSVTVTLADRSRLVADVIAFGDNGLDLAVLKIRGGNNLPTISLTSTPVQVGQRAFAIGNPFGQFQGTFTVGIVSRIDRERGLIQTDAAINPGNSGGPLLNGQGELIGVNSAIFSSSGGGNIGIGFAIALDRVKPFLAAVREGRASRTTVRQNPTPSNREPQTLALNSPVINGKLGPGSNVLPVDNSFFDLYAFQGRVGQRVEIDMIGQEIDPYLILLDPNGNDLAQDDDSGGGNNARIAITLPETGTYLLIANSYQARQAGTYKLRTQGTATATSGGNSVSQERFILREEGNLGYGSSVLPSDGSLFNLHTFEGTAGESVTISAVSADFDTYVALLDSNGNLIGENDDASENNPNATLTITLPRTGRYGVIVNSYDKTGRGQYVLTVR